jgi:cytochrome c2
MAGRKRPDDGFLRETGLRDTLKNVRNTSQQFEGIANDDVRKTVIGFLKALQ